MCDSHVVIKYVVWWYRLLVTSIFVVFAVFLVGTAFQSSELGGRVYASVGATFIIMLAIRAARGASIELTASEVIIRGMRVRQIPWAEIESVEVGQGSSVAFRAWRVPCLVLTSGAVACADEVRSRRTPSIVDDVVRDIRGRLSELGR